MLLLLGTNLLTSCKTKLVPVNNYCVIYTPVKAIKEDKQALKDSLVSKEFIEQIVNNNDIWDQTCQQSHSLD